MRVGRVEAGEDALADVGLVVAVGVLEEHQVGRLGDQDAAVGELEPGRAVQAVGEDGLLVGLAVAVGVFEDQELVVHLLLGLPVRVGRPAGDPEPALGVERHLHRLGQLGELLLGGEQVDLQVLADGHLADGFLAAQEDVLAVRPGARLVGLDRDERGRVRVVDRQVLALRDGPDPLVAVGGHHVEDFHLALGDHAVGLAVGEAQVGAAAEDRVAVDRPVAVEPVEVLVEDGLAELVEVRLALRGPIAGSKPVDDHRRRVAGCRSSFRWTPLIVSGSAAFSYRDARSGRTGRRRRRRWPWPPRPSPRCRA